MCLLIEGYQRNHIQSVQTFECVQSRKATLACQVVVGHDHDVRHELAACKALFDPLEQFLLMRLIKTRGLRIGRRQKRQTDS